MMLMEPRYRDSILQCGLPSGLNDVDAGPVTAGLNDVAQMSVPASKNDVDGGLFGSHHDDE